MSHIVTVSYSSPRSAGDSFGCSRLKLPAPNYGTAKLFVAEKSGLDVRLNGWSYPVVCNTDTGELDYDNYGGKWGQQQELDKFLQAYAVEKAKLEARKAGHTTTEQQLVDGSIRVCVQVA